jgi:hypothetical protein
MEDLEDLKQRWMASGSFEDEQAYLAALVRLEKVKFVYLDPDGTLHDWLGVVVRHETGVVYGTQCGGVATLQRLIQGYLVLLGGSTYDVDEEIVRLDPLYGIFHEDDACKWNWVGRALPTERLTALSDLVRSIPYWQCNFVSDGSKYPLQLDTSRMDEIAEAWIPVETPDGAGVLVYKNCD